MKNKTVGCDSQAKTLVQVGYVSCESGCVWWVNERMEKCITGRLNLIAPGSGLYISTYSVQNECRGRARVVWASDREGWIGLGVDWVWGGLGLVGRERCRRRRWGLECVMWMGVGKEGTGS